MLPQHSMDFTNWHCPATFHGLYQFTLSHTFHGLDQFALSKCNPKTLWNLTAMLLKHCRSINLSTWLLQSSNNHCHLYTVCKIPSQCECISKQKTHLHLVLILGIWKDYIHRFDSYFVCFSYNILIFRKFKQRDAPLSSILLKDCLF